VTRDPHDPIGCIDHERHRIAVAPGHFTVHEKILQLLPPAEPDRLETVAGTAVTSSTSV